MADLGAGHADHDPLVVASLIDRDDPADADRTTAQAWIRDCPGCASLYADLLALATATRTSPAPSRPRDFRLTTADAARLRAEPSVPSPRLTGVMTDPPATSSHQSHDTTLVASLADHSLAPTERAAAEALVATCSACAALRADLLTLVAATRAMPTPPRTTEYTLSQDQAARLRPNPWRRLVAAIGSSRDGVTRPLAIGLSTLGLVGLLVTSAPGVVPGGLGGSATSSASGEAAQPITAAPGGLTDTAGEGAPGAAAAPPNPGDAAVTASLAPERAAAESPAPVYGVTNAGPIPGASPATQADGNGKGAVADAAEPSPSTLEATTTLAVPAPSSGVDPMLIISTAFLVVGLGLFLLRWSARRITAG